VTALAETTVEDRASIVERQHRPRSMHRSPTPIVVGALVAVAAATARAWVLAAPGAPPGIDTGNWIAFGNALFGHSVKPASVAYPPVVPLLMTALSHLVGPTVGASIVGGLAALAPAAGVLVVLWLANLRWWSVAIASTVLFLGSTGAMTSWGGFPQLIGAPVALIVYWSLDRWMTDGRRSWLVGGALAWGALVATSHFVALIAAVGLVTVFFVRLVEGRRRLGRALIGAAALVATSLPVALIYARLIPAVIATRSGGGVAAARIDVSEAPRWFVDIFGVAAPFVALGVIAAIAAAFIARERTTLWAIDVALLVSSIVAFFVTREPRLIYDVAVVAAIGIGALIEALRDRPSWRWSRGVAATAVVAAAVVATTAGAADAARSRDRYAVLDVPAAQALEWIREHTPADAVVASVPYRGAPIGWWVEGLAERRSLSVVEPRWLVFPEERTDAAVAALIFRRLGAAPSKGFDAARDAGVDVLLLPAHSDAASAVAAELETGSLHLAFADRAFLVLLVERPGGATPRDAT
jgi:hypothetical protein